MSRDKAAQYASSLQRNISLYFPFLAYYQISYYKSKPQRSKDHFSHDRFVLVLLWLSGRNCLTPLRLADLCRLDFRWELQIGHFTEKDVMMRTYANFSELLRRPVCVCFLIRDTYLCKAELEESLGDSWSGAQLTFKALVSTVWSSVDL